MEEFPKIYSIRIQGRLHDRWKNWFNGMKFTSLDSEETIIEGLIVDQSELIGVINQIHNLNLKLISINCNDENT